MAYYASEVVRLAQSWIGLKESDGSYKKILDIYNKQPKKPRGVTMTTKMSWCATTWSALALKLGYEKVMPIECSCGQLIEQAKKMGIWVEKDSYVAQPGDAILYDWSDSGKGDCTGWPDHVGVIEKTDANKGLFTVIEGNYADSVKRRTIGINARYIRGFITPKYDDESKKDTKPTQNDNKPKVVKASEAARSKDKRYYGSFKTSNSTALRDGAGTDKSELTNLPAYQKVTCYGYYSMSKTNMAWLYVQTKLKDVTYEGYIQKGLLISE